MRDTGKEDSKLNKMQFRFIKEQSTVDTMDLIRKTSEQTNTGDYGIGDLCSMITIHIKNQDISLFL